MSESALRELGMNHKGCGEENNGYIDLSGKIYVIKRKRRLDRICRGDILVFPQKDYIRIEVVRRVDSKKGELDSIRGYSLRTDKRPRFKDLYAAHYSYLEEHININSNAFSKLSDKDYRFGRTRN